MRKSAFTAVVLLAIHQVAVSGYGGMGNVDSSDTGGVSFWTLLGALALLVGGFYAATVYASKFEGNMGYGRIAIGILVVLIALSFFQ